MSLNQIIAIGRSSLQTLNAAMNTTGQNIANANTEGFVRRRLSLESVEASGLTKGKTSIPRPMGAGVMVGSYERTRDKLLLSAGWLAQSSLGSAQEDQRVLGAVEGLFPSSQGASLGAVLNDFWNRWSDLADNPTDDGSRLALRNRATSLALTFNRLDTDLRNLQQETDSNLSESVKKVNGLLSEISSLNRTIREGRMQGSPDMAAEDQRDLKVKELAAFVPVRVQEAPYETYFLSIGGMRVVQEDTYLGLTLERPGGTPRIVFTGTDVQIPTDPRNDGKLGSILRAVTQTIPETRAKLDQLAGALVTEVNALHQDRHDDAGAPAGAGPAFFHYAAGPPEEGVTAATLRISDAIAADHKIIGAPGYYTAGGEEIALALAGLRATPLASTNDQTTEHFAIAMLSDIGTKIRDANNQATAQTATVAHLEAMERGVSGVSLDEEMINLIRYQQAYGATGRVLSTAQQMMDVLLSI